MNTDYHIKRRADGSIDLDYYDSVARRLRARDQSSAITWLISPLMVLLRDIRARPGKRVDNQASIGPT